MRIMTKPARTLRSRLHPRCGVCALLLFAVLAGCMALAQPAENGDELIGFLNQSIAWYHRLQFPNQLANDPSDSVYAGYNRNAGLQVLARIFDFAREQARQLQLENPQTASAAPAATSGSGTPGSRLQQLIAAAHQRLDQAAADLNELLKQSGSADGKKRQTLDAQIAEQKSELDLAQARLETLEDMNAFTAAESAAGLLGKIAELERTVPELEAMERALHPPSKSEAGKTTASTPAPAAVGTTPPSQPAASAPPRQTGNGMLSLAGDLFSLIRKMNAQSDALKATAKLRQELNTIRDPQRKRLRETIQRGEELSGRAQSTDPAVLADRKKQIDTLTTDFRRLSITVLPLAKVTILLDSATNNLESWHAETERAYMIQGRALLVRVAALFMAILVVVLIIFVALSTEIGSLATFAGFLTAGIAVALQNVILSVVAYFFLIGRHGIRVGDRIQIGDVTGDVVDIGLVRLHLMELDIASGDARPTGRIVTFSNSVVFQPTSNFFKQLPGSNFAWRRITLTLAADVDYGLAQRCISDAVAKVYGSYKAELELQHRTLENSLAVPIGSTEPRTRLRLEEGGLEIVVLYPVILSRATQIDDLMTHALLQTIEAEPRLRLVGGGLTNIQPVDANISNNAQPHAAQAAPHPVK